MNVWQIAEKLFNFCEEKYPDLEWRWNYYSYGDIDGWKEVSSILASYSLFKLELEICSDKKQEFYEKEATYDYILGRLFILQSEEKSLLPWSGSFTVNLNHNKNSELELMLATHDDWNNDSWSVVKQARKIVREIFNFIEDEIQE